MDNNKIDHKTQVIIKMWFDSVNGNTYHNVNFNYNNKNYNSGLTYGYETQYKVTLENMIKKHNLTSLNWVLLGLDSVNYIVMDVKTEQELEKIDYFNQI